MDKKRMSFPVYFKQRYGDFIVREVSEDGKIVTLTDTTTLPDWDKQVEESQSQTYTDEDVVNAFKDIIGDEQVAVQLLSYSKMDSKVVKDKFQVTGKVTEEKELRKQFHDAVRKYFSGNLESELNNSGKEKSIEVFFPQKRRRMMSKNTARGWPSGKPEYLQFVLYKENIDTTVALEALSKATGLPSKTFDTAGTKDKRAITSQLITIKKVDAKRIRDSAAKLKGIKVGNFSYVHKPLKLGSLHGNHFTITLRGIEAPMDVVVQACESVKKFGFINYFGTQRFGTSAIPTHHVGKYLLLSKWEEAINLVLTPRAFEKWEITEARIHWMKTKDATSTLQVLPRYQIIEKILLRGIEEYGCNLTAFSKLPLNMRLLYVHAYQSYIWNEMASKRIDMAPTPEDLVPIPGDLVYDTKLNDHIYVDQNNISNYTITDVVLPLPGYSVKYPKNAAYDHIKEVMARDGLDPTDMKRNIRIYSLPGGYRFLLRKPMGLEYSIYQYNDLCIPLALTDLDVMEGKKEPQSAPDGSRTALVIKMGLDSATYATMVIRELTKYETSQIAQKELQSKYDREQEGKEEEAQEEDIEPTEDFQINADE
uniref:TRUD domain-containing protein n=1 Tax=Arcella intermedia TaxID=1963864 RepID=A0A6B2L0D4_9EUKA